MRIGIGVGATTGQDGTIEEVVSQVTEAEKGGFGAAWMANVFSHEALTTLAVAGHTTSSIHLGTFVMPTYTRHPFAMAQQALTTTAAAGGRLTLGIGLSHKVVIENMLGLDYSKPVRHMREYLSVLLPLLAGERVAFQGEEYRVNALLAPPGAPRPEVIVAALGPQMLRLTGRMADGTATWMGGPSYLESIAIPAIRAGAAEAGRPDPRIVAGFPIAVTTNIEAAKEAAAQAYVTYGQLPSYRAALDAEGAPGPADIAILGDETAVRAQLRRLRDMGVTDFLGSIYYVKADPEARQRTYDLLAAISRSGL